MLGHYVSMGLRAFRRSPFSTAINIFTLALGLACFLVAYAIVGYWDRAERAYPNADRTYVITADLEATDGSISTGVSTTTNNILAENVETDFPQLDAVARARSGIESSVSTGDKSMRLYLAYADPDFLKIFDLPFIHGDPKTALDNPNGVILTEASAIKLFGRSDVVGEPLVFASNVDGTVSGVVSALPQPSHMGDLPTSNLRFDILAPWKLLDRFNDISRRAQQAQAAARRNAGNRPQNGNNPPPQAQGTPPQGGQANANANPPTPPQRPANWLGGYCCTTYVMFPKNGAMTAKSFNAQLKEFGDRHVPPQQKALATVEFGAVPVSGVVVTGLNATLFGSGAANISVTTLLFLLGGLVLAVACLNYANLATAQANFRAPEVGLRKVVGANRRQVLTQHLIEAGMLTVVALIVAFIAVWLVVPVLRELAGIDLRVAMFAGAGFWAFIAALVVGVTLLAGAYPAFVLSRVRPVIVMRGGKGRGPRLVPTLLVGLQFVAASFLLTAVIIMYNQNSDLRQSGLGTDKDPVAVVTNASQFTGVKPEVLRDELSRIPQVISVGATGQMPWSPGVSLIPLSRTPEEASAQYTAITNGVDYTYFSTMDIPVLAGRNFDEEHGNDKMPDNGIMGLSQDRPGHVVVDQTFAKEMGFAKPEDAVGQLVYLSAKMAHMMGRQDAQPLQVIGVVADRPQRFKGIGANGNIFFLNENQAYQLVRLKAAEVGQGVDAINAVWKRLAPRTAISFRFVDDVFDQNFRVYSNINKAFTGLSVFALVISSIGLFGMAIRITSRRIREIGVRKTIGASTRQILTMLIRDFSIPVIIANIIAWPLAFLAGKVYLSFFIHQTTMTPLPFAVSFVFTLLIAWIAVGGQAWRAARVKPAEVLKYE